METVNAPITHEEFHEMFFVRPASEVPENLMRAGKDAEQEAVMIANRYADEYKVDGEIVDVPGLLARLIGYLFQLGVSIASEYETKDEINAFHYIWFNAFSSIFIQGKD